MQNNYFVLKVFLFLILFISKFSYGEVENNKLPFKEYIKLATNNDLTFQEILSDSYKVAYNYDNTLPSSDVIVEVQNNYYFSMNENEKNDEASMSLSKLFPQIGTALELNYESSETSYSSDNATVLTAKVSQSIAQNAFGNGYRIEKEKISIGNKLALYQVVEAYEDYLATVSGVYYQWFSDYENMKNAESILNENKKLLNNVIRKKRYKIADQLDVDKINVQILDKKDNLITLKNQYSETYEKIKQITGLKNNINYTPVYDKIITNDLPFDYNYNEFLSTGRTSLILNLMDKQGTLEVKQNADNLLPSLDLLFGYRKKGDGYRVKNSTDDLFAGFSFKYSLGQQKNSAVYELSKVELKQTKLSIKNIKIKLKTDLKNLYNSIKMEKELVKLSQSKINLGWRILKSEVIKYKQARSTLQDVITAINNIEDYKIKKTLHNINLKIYYIEWLRLNDLLVKKNILLK